MNGGWARRLMWLFQSSSAKRQVDVRAYIRDITAGVTTGTPNLLTFSLFCSNMSSNSSGSMFQCLMQERSQNYLKFQNLTRPLKRKLIWSQRERKRLRSYSLTWRSKSTSSADLSLSYSLLLRYIYTNCSTLEQSRNCQGPTMLAFISSSKVTIFLCSFSFIATAFTLLSSICLISDSILWPICSIPSGQLSCYMTFRMLSGWSMNPESSRSCNSQLLRLYPIMLSILLFFSLLRAYRYLLQRFYWLAGRKFLWSFASFFSIRVVSFFMNNSLSNFYWNSTSAR